MTSKHRTVPVDSRAASEARLPILALFIKSSKPDLAEAF